MDFDFKKPAHILALILILVTFIFIIIIPFLTYFGLGPFTPSEQFPQSYQILFEIILLFIQITFVFLLLVIFPILWYLLVNKIHIKEIFARLRLRMEGIDIALLWGVVAALIVFGLILIITTILVILGYTDDELSNIPDLEQYFSIPSMFLLITIQPICEEFFFRGFLLEKIEPFTGKNIAVLSTAVLFGIAHMNYGKIYPTLMPIVMGVVLGFIVIKTKNLYSAIIAHIIFNLSAFILYLFQQSLTS